MNWHKLSFMVGVALIVLGCSAGPEVGSATTAPGTLESDAIAFVNAMKPSHQRKPVVVVLARNEATKTTDFLLTHAVLQRSGLVDLHAVAPKRGRVSLYPVLEVEVQEDFAQFDRAYPGGADYVIVPAMLYEKNEDSAVTSWLKQQASRGARIVGVCAGALVVGSAGLLDDRNATTHWYFRKVVWRDAGRREAEPETRQRGAATAGAVPAGRHDAGPVDGAVHQ